MKVVEQGETTGLHGTLFSPVTIIYPFLEPEDDETKPMEMESELGGTYESDLLPGSIEVSSRTGRITLNFDSEWLWEPTPWPLDLAEKFAQGMIKAVEIGRVVEAKTASGS